MPAKDVDTVAEECDGDQQHLPQSTHVREAIVRQTWKGSLLRTTADSGKSHDVAGPRRTEVVDEVKWGHVVWPACHLTTCDQDVGRRGGDVELDWDCDIGGFMKPAEVGGNGAEDYGDSGKLDCRDG